MRPRLLLAAVVPFVCHAGGVARAQTPAPPPEAPPAYTAFSCEPAPTLAAHAARTACRSGEPAADAPGRFEESRGRSHALAGAGIGLVVGGGATLAVLYGGGSTSLCDRSANQDAMAPRECAGLTVLGALAGGALGAVIGSRIRTGRGQAYSAAPLHVALAPLPGRSAGLALSVAFRPPQSAGRP